MPFDKEKELRRERSTLRSLALGIVAFGLWSVLKTIISLMMVPLEEILDSEALAAVTNSGLRFAVYAVMVITALAIMSVDLIPRLYVARKARREGLGEDQGRGWIIWAVILLVFWIVLDIIEITGLPGQIKDAAKGPLDSIVTLAVDLTANCNGDSRRAVLHGLSREEARGGGLSDAEGFSLLRHLLRRHAGGLECG